MASVGYRRGYVSFAHFLLYFYIANEFTHFKPHYDQSYNVALLTREDSDQSGHMLKLIRVICRRISKLVC